MRPRPIDIHERLIAAAGGTYRTSNDGSLLIEFRRGCRPFAESVLSNSGISSVGASVTALLLAAVAPGVSRITDLAQEPEVRAVAETLIRLGVPVVFEAGSVTCVEGGGQLGGTAECDVVADYSQAFTYLLVGLASRGAAEVSGIGVQDLPYGMTHVLQRCGIALGEMHTGGTSRVTAVLPSNSSPQPSRVTTGTYPAFPSDAQPMLAAFLTSAEGVSTIDEAVYGSRSTHVGELARLGLQIETRGPTQVIRGGQQAQGGVAEALDIRCGAALMVAAASSSGQVTKILDPARHLARAYPQIERNLSTLGLQVMTW